MGRWYPERDLSVDGQHANRRADPFVALRKADSDRLDRGRAQRHDDMD
jgi:hypothetical protein